MPDHVASATSASAKPEGPPAFVSPVMALQYQPMSALMSVLLTPGCPHG
jgi:hypothetical protein